MNQVSNAGDVHSIPEVNQYLSVTQASAIFNKNPRTIRRWLEIGKLKGFMATENNRKFWQLFPLNDFQIAELVGSASSPESVSCMNTVTALSSTNSIQQSISPVAEQMPLDSAMQLFSTESEDFVETECQSCSHLLQPNKFHLRLLMAINSKMNLSSLFARFKSA